VKIRLTCIAAVLFALSLPVAAQNTSSTATSATATVPRLITFSGTLSHAAIEADQSGVVLAPSAAPTQVVAITFSLYAEETSSAPLWSEVQNVHVDSGARYTVQLGASKPDGLPMDIFTSVQAQWLGVQPQDHAEQPRVLLVSVPYALKSGDAETFGGKPPSAYALAPLAETSLPGRGPTAVGNGGSHTQPNTPHPLPISGSGTTNYVPLWTNASNLSSSVIYQSPTGGIGIGTTTPQGQLDVITNSALIGISGENLATSGSGVGTGGHTKGSTGIGVFGVHDSSTGAGMGVSGLTFSPAGVGVNGSATSTTGLAIGVSGASASSRGVGVFGVATSPGSAGNNSFGVEGQARDPDGAGGNFINSAVTGEAIGVGAITDSSSGRAVYGVGVTGSTTQVGLGNGITVGVWGDSGEGAGVGVVGTEDAGVAVAGQNNSTTNAAGYFENTSTSGSAATGVEGKSNSSGSFGVYGVNTTSGYGVYGQSSTGVAILGACVPTGSNSCFNGTAGLNTSTSGAANGVWALTMSPQGNAVYMVNSGGGNLLFGTQSDGGNATFYVQGNGSGYFGGAVQINGNLNVGGTLTKGGGSFKIDDPLDPANKYLSHSFVESPDMMNIYNGIVRLDAHGEAWVVLPDYFESLNRDFRYQLTSVGTPQPRLYIAREVSGERFKIAGGKPNAKVSWQVTGIRHDAWANAHRIPTEEDKPPQQRGTYLYPELFENRANQNTNAMLQH
jgi:hypothetical protein